MSTAEPGDRITFQPRGILNISGVACHLTSALQLLLCVVDELRQALCMIGETAQLNAVEGNELSWFEELARLGSNYSGTATSAQNDVPLDPSRLYRALESSSSFAVSPHELGDAATAFRLLLQAIRQKCLEQSSRELSPLRTLKRILDVSLTGGTSRQKLLGTAATRTDHTDDDEMPQHHSKVGKERSIACPFPLPGSCATLQDALFHATVQPELLAGYAWPQQDSRDSSSDDLEWTTHRTMLFTGLPQYLLLQPQRFLYRQGTMVRMENEFLVHQHLDMTQYCDASLVESTSPCCLRYKLSGAILHLSEDQQVEEVNEEEQGHYVTLIRRAPDDEWVLLDDDKVRVFEQSEIDAVLSGDPSCLYCAVVLAYRNTCSCRSHEMLEAIDELRQCLKLNSTTFDHDEGTDWSMPQNFVGRRLRIRWTKGNYYSGIVQSYDDTTGKHTVLYDDGDVRQYNLRKKAVQWDNA